MKGFAPFGLSVVQSCNAVFRECTSPTELVSEIIDEIGWHEPRLKRKCEATDVGTSPPFSGVRLPSDRGVFPPTAVVFIPSRRLAGSTATSSTRDREATIHCARARVVETALTTLRAMRHGLEGSLGRSTASRPATPGTDPCIARGTRRRRTRRGRATGSVTRSWTREALGQPRSGRIHVTYAKVAADVNINASDRSSRPP